MRWRGLAVNWMHPVADGFAGSQFLKAWSDACARARASTAEPDHARARALKKAHFLDGVFCDRDLAAYYTPPGLERVVWTRDMAAALQALAASAPPRQTAIMRLVHYTEAGIRKLKAAVALTATTNTSGKDFSTVTCVSAHLWQCLTRARLRVRQAQENGTCICISAVDAKMRRTSPSNSSSAACPDSGSNTLLPASYFGNSIMMVQTREVEPEEVVRQPLGFAASLVKDSVAGIHLREYHYLLALCDKHGPGNITRMPRAAAHDFVTSSWYRFPFYDLGFCFPARPVLAVPHYTRFPSGGGLAIFLPSALGPNNLTAMLLANASVMANLSLDQEFLEYAY